MLGKRFRRPRNVPAEVSLESAKTGRVMIILTAFWIWLQSCGCRILGGPYLNPPSRLVWTHEN